MHNFLTCQCCCSALLHKSHTKMHINSLYKYINGSHLFLLNGYATIWY